MTPASTHSFDVTVENFESDVIAASDSTTIVCYFYAESAPPSKTIAPLLETLAAAYDGRFRLARVNADEQPEVAQMFGIRSLPTVIAVKAQKPVNAFQGALPEEAVRQFLDKVCPSEGDGRLAKAKDKLNSGDISGATDLIRVALALDPKLDAARVMLADIAMRDNRTDEARTYLEACAPVNQLDDEWKRVATKIAAAVDAGNSPEAEALKARIQLDDNDHEARLQLAAVMVAEGQFEPAFQTLLESITLNRSWNEQAARKKMVEYFSLALEQPELVRRYRQALATALN